MLSVSCWASVASVFPGGRSINTRTPSQHARAQGTHTPLGILGGLVEGPLSDLPKRVQADLGFLCDLGFLRIQEMRLQNSRRSRVLKWVILYQLNLDRSPFVCSAHFGPLEPWLPWVQSPRSHSSFTENAPPPPPPSSDL